MMPPKTSLRIAAWKYVWEHQYPLRGGRFYSAEECKQMVTELCQEPTAEFLIFLLSECA